MLELKWIHQLVNEINKKINDYFDDIEFFNRKKYIKNRKRRNKNQKSMIA